MVSKASKQIIEVTTDQNTDIPEKMPCLRTSGFIVASQTNPYVESARRTKNTKERKNGEKTSDQKQIHYDLHCTLFRPVATSICQICGATCGIKIYGLRKASSTGADRRLHATCATKSMRLLYAQELPEVIPAKLWRSLSRSVTNAQAGSMEMTLREAGCKIKTQRAISRLHKTRLRPSTLDCAIAEHSKTGPHRSGLNKSRVTIQTS
jgi:hypothetical protein